MTEYIIIVAAGAAERDGSTLNGYAAAPAGGDELVAVSSSEVYFQRTARCRRRQ